MNSVQVVPCVDSCVQLVLFNLKLRTALDIRRLFETNVLIAVSYTHLYGFEGGI